MDTELDNKKNVSSQLWKVYLLSSGLHQAIKTWEKKEKNIKTWELEAVSVKQNDHDLVKYHIKSNNPHFNKKN